MEVVGHNGDLLLAWGVEFTNDTQNLANATSVQIKVDDDTAGFADADGIFDFWANLITLNEFKTYRFWRPALITKNASTTNLTSARVGGVIEIWKA